MEQHRRRERRIDGEGCALVPRELRERGNVGNAKERICDRFDVEQRRRFRSERA
jgi:hypothetical protein